MVSWPGRDMPLGLSATTHSYHEKGSPKAPLVSATANGLKQGFEGGELIALLVDVRLAG